MTALQKVIAGIQAWVNREQAHLGKAQDLADALKEIESRLEALESQK